VHDELLALERRFWEAAGDPDFYRRRFAEDGRCVFGFGVMDKAATVAAMESAPPWTTYEINGVTLVELGPQVAALTYSAAATRRGDEPYEAVVSSVYVHRDGEWQLALHHQIPRVAGS
jgi:hypothetical protein